MKTLDIVAAVLLVIGGLNWGLVGFFNMDIIATVFGQMTMLTRVVYGLIGLSALYYIFNWRTSHKRSKKR